MSFDYPEFFVGDVCSVGDGAHSKVVRVQEGIPYLTSKNIGQGVLKLDNYDCISDVDFNRLFPVKSSATRRPIAGDILIGIIGTFGNAYLYKDGDCFGFSSSIGIIRPNKEILNSKFLYYVLTSQKFRTTHLNYNAGSVQGYTNIPTIKKLKVPIPSLTEQKEIASILSALDNRISLLRETNTTLEAIAQTLFKSWFVDFDPVKAKAEGRLPEGMDEATAALFPSEFEESALGLIPKGWRVGALGDVAFLNPESWTAKNHPKFIEYIDLANTKDNQIASTTNYVFEEAPSRAKRVLRDGDTIIGTVRPSNRSFAFIHNPVGGLTGSTGFAVLRPKIIENTAFTFFASTSDTSIDYLGHVADGGAYPAVRPEVVVNIEVVLPDIEIMRAFNSIAAVLLEKIGENEQQSQTLTTLRDTLLPRLISGQLRLNQAQEIMDEVGA